MRRLSPPVLTVGCLLALSLTSHAQTIFTFTGNGETDSYQDVANWTAPEGFVAPPPTDGSAIIKTSSWVHNLQFIGGPIDFDCLLLDNSAYPGTDVMLGSETHTSVGFTKGVTRTSTSYWAAVNFEPSVDVRLEADQTWDVRSVSFLGSVGGSGHLNFAPNAGGGRGYLLLGAENDFAGGLSVSNAYVTLQHAAAVAGTGDLDFANVTFTTGLNLSIANQTTLRGVIDFYDFEAGQGHFDFTGSVSLDGDVTLNNYLTAHDPITFSGGMGEADGPSELIIDAGSFILGGSGLSSTYTGGTHVAGGKLFFRDAAAVPATGEITADVNGYAGIAFGVNVQTLFIDRISASNFKGTIGLDTAPGAEVQTTVNDLDVSGVDPDFLGLGSSTTARISGDLLIGEGTDYRFGGGGGTLFISSNLAAASAGVSLMSYDDPLKLVLQSANTFGGSVSILNGGLVLDHTDALPDTAMIYPQGTNPIYFGATQNAAEFDLAALYARVSWTGQQVLIGLDSADINSPRVLTDPVDLSLGGTVNAPYFFGTSSALRVGATITPPDSSGDLYLATFGGTLSIDAPLTTLVRDLYIGQNNGPKTEGTVALTVANNHRGDTILQSGTLALGDDQALGTGRLRIDSSDYNPVFLRPLAPLTLTNDIELGSQLAIGRNDEAFDLELLGHLAPPQDYRYAYYGLNYFGAGQLGLHGTGRSFQIEANGGPNSSISLGGNYADTRIYLHAGRLIIEAGLHTLSGVSTDAGTTTELASGATLRLDGSSYYYEESPYADFFGTVTGDGSILIDGNFANLYLDSPNSFTGGVSAQHAVIKVGDSLALGTGTLRVQGDNEQTVNLVALAAGIDLANPVELSGGLTVSGDYYEDAHPLTLSGVISGKGWIDVYAPLTLAGHNTFAGSIFVEDTTIDFLHDDSAGQAGLQLSSYYGNNSTVATFHSQAPKLQGLDSYYSGPQVELATGSNLTVEVAEESSYAGGIHGDNASLTKTGIGTLTLGGTLAIDGGVRVAEGNLIFGSLESVGNLGDSPTNSLSVAAPAYAGVLPSSLSFSNFLTRLDPANTAGGIGFDAPPYYTAEITEGGGTVIGFTPYFAGTIDLSAFNPAVRLGTSTEAVLGQNTVLTPAGDAQAAYRFGNGGGFLTVETPLTGPRGIEGESAPLNSLLVLFTGANTFAGDVSATYTGLVFGPGALPASAHLNLGPGGYISSAAPSVTVADFLARFDATTHAGIIGFDRVPESYNSEGSPRVLSAGLNLTRFVGSELPFIGTASDLIVRGPIFLPDATSTLRLAGYKGGHLTVESAITGAGVSVQIGDPANLATFGNARDESTSTVSLTGANTYSGGTVLTTGRLAVAGDGVASGLGTGPLTVAPHGYQQILKDAAPELSPAGPVAVLPNDIVLDSDLYAYAEGESRLILNGQISGAAGLMISGSGSTQLNGPNSYAGGTWLAEGNLGLGHDQALGSGPLTLAGYSIGLIAQNGPRTISNAVNFDFSNYSYITFSGNDLTLTGDVSISSANTYLVVENDLFLDGRVMGHGNVELGGHGRVWVTDATQFGGSIYPSSAFLILQDVAAVAVSDQAVNGLGSGYFGLATPPANLQGDFVDLFDPSSYGTVIGFDTLPGQTTNDFTGDIDLTAFENFYTDVALGTASSAILSGAITPANGTYRFGRSSQGALTIASDLTNGDDESSRSLYMDAYAGSGFVLRLTGQNSYSGHTFVNSGALVLASDQALPPASYLEVSSDAYVGVEHPGVSFASLVATLPSYSTNLLLGFDSADPAAPRTLTSPDLSHFTGESASIGLGTTSAAIIDGTITLPESQAAYSFFGYGGGQLVVNSDLTGEFARVEIARPFVTATVNESNLGLPGVTLNGNNTYGGGTQFYGGRLTVGSANALGTGPLTIIDYNSNAEHILSFGVDHLDNDLQVNADVMLRSAQPTVNLNGVLSGEYHRIGIFDDFSLNLNGANTLSNSQIIVAAGSIHFGSDNATVGTDNSLVFMQNGGAASFDAPHPRLAGLQQQAGAAATLDLASGTTLELDLNTPTFFGGVISGDGTLQKSGGAKLTLTGDNTYTGGTVISGGLLHAATPHALGTGAVTLDGGLLSLAPGVDFANPFSFGAGGGKLGGNGTFNGPVNLTANSGLAPGNSVGAMTFSSDLTWSGGAFFDLEVEDAVGARGVGYDTVYVGGTLVFAATPASPFTVNLLTIDTGSGTTLAFDNSAYYTWTLASATNITGFDADAFDFNLSGFDANTGTLGNFFATSNGTELFINFSPVPEPSTYTLYGVGLLLLAGRAWGRRRRS